MTDLTVIDSDDPAWDALLARAGFADAYLCSAYHRLAACEGRRALMFAHGAGERLILLPLVLRPLQNHAIERSWDATSIYGYAGPMAVGDFTSAEIRAFQLALRRMLLRLRVVSLFARLHPVYADPTLIEGLGEMRHHGRTVALDLHAAEERQMAQYRPNHRQDLRQLAARGYHSTLETAGVDLDLFHLTYLENMRRVEAAPEYFFDRGYFESLAARLGRNSALVLCRKGDELAAGALFLAGPDIVQCHLACVADRHLKAAPLKQVIDTARRHFSLGGHRLLHLGGGLRGEEDTLYHFKAGFSKRRYPFRTWRWVVDPLLYGELCALSGRNPLTTDWFPAYREGEPGL